MLSNPKKGTPTKFEELCKGLKCCVIDKGNYCVRKTLESWHTAKTFNADNNFKPLPRPFYCN